MKISWARQSYTNLFFIKKTTQECRYLYANTRHAHSSGSGSCRKHLERSDAHMSTSLFAVFSFLQRIHISRKTYSFTRLPDAEHWTRKKTHIWLRFLSVLASFSSVVALLSSLSVTNRKDQLAWFYTRRKHRISILSCTQWTYSGGSDLLTEWTAQDTTHNCFLSHYLFSHGLIIGCAGFQLLPTTKTGFLFLI